MDKDVVIMKKMEVDILKGQLDKVIWIIIIPIIATNLIDGLYGIIDSLFVASVGSLAVASVTFVSPLQDTFNAVGIGLSLAGCGLIATYIGAQDEERARKMMGHVLSVGCLIGFALSAFAFCFTDFILINSGATETLLPDASLYLRFISWSVGLNFIVLLYLAVERAQGNTKQAMTINLLSLGLKIVFCYLLTVVVDWGIAGIGLATVLAKGICAIVCVISLMSKKKKRYLKLVEYKWELSIIKVLVITALPLVIEKSLVSYGFVIVNKYVLSFGEAVLAAYGITNKVNTVFFMAVTAFGYGLAVIVAQNVGAKNIERAKQAVWKAMGYALLTALLYLCFLIPLRPWIAELFVEISDPTYQHVINAMGIYTASILPWAITECVLGIFQGTGYTMYNLLISIVRIYVLRVPVVMILSMPIWGLEETGIWLAMLLSNIFCAMFSISIYLLKRKKIFGINKNESH